MIVFIAGMQRSGSTFSFNVAKDILAARGSVYQDVSGSIADVVLKSGGPRHVIMKNHSADDLTVRLVKLGAVKAIITVRRPEDAIASWMETFGFDLDSSISELSEWLRMYARLRRHALVITYEQVDKQCFLAAYKIAKYLDPRATLPEIIRTEKANSKRNVMELAQSIRVGDAHVCNANFTAFHMKNYYHYRHVRSLNSRRGRDILERDQILKIRAALCDYINEDGDVAV